MGVGSQPVRHDATVDARKHGLQPRVVRARDDAAVERHFVGKFHEGLLQISEAPVTVHVLAIDVGQHRDGRPEHQKRPIALVRFRSSTTAIIDVVVVLPCDPATAIENRSRISSASISARGITGIPRREASTISGFDGRTADEKTTTSASPTCTS